VSRRALKNKTTHKIAASMKKSKDDYKEKLESFTGFQEFVNSTKTSS